MEKTVLPTEILALIFQSLGIEWVKTCEAICQDHFSGSDFDLAKYFIEELLVPTVKMVNDPTAKELTYVSRNINDLKKLIVDYGHKPSLFKKNIFKNDELKLFLREFLKDKITISMQIKAKNLLDHCSKFLESSSWWVVKPTTRNHRYSKTISCLMKLVRLYHALTGVMPEFRHNGSQEGTDKEFSGEFYNFLLEVKPLLKNIGIDLGKNSNLGECARQVLRQHKKNLSFLNIEVPSLQWVLS